MLTLRQGGVAWSTLSTLKYKRSRLDALDQAVEILRRLKPDGQAYFNEAYYDEPKWESESFPLCPLATKAIE